MLIVLICLLAIRLLMLKRHKVIAWIALGIGAAFSLFVLNLIVFHSCLLARNITTWEFLSW
jgi:hypothetical protein